MSMSLVTNHALVTAIQSERRAFAAETRFTRALRAVARDDVRRAARFRSAWLLPRRGQHRLATA
jgi:hypothetical protein